jgi:hypothetical protein
MKKSIKPRISMRKLLAVGIVFLTIPMLPGCDKAEDIGELFDKIEYFQFDYKMVPSASTSTNTAIALIEAEDATFLNGMARFISENPEINAGASNEARVFGNPTQAGSSFSIRMRRNAQNDLSYVSEISIESPQGPFSVGQVLTTATITVNTGPVSTGKTYTSNTVDAQGRVKITSINTIAKKFGGEFYFVLRDPNNPANADFLAGAEGTFLFNY